MPFKLLMLGTGGAFAKRYYNNNALILKNGQRLLIDCGITAPLALHQMGVRMDALDGILITHLHGDHVGGLEEVAFQLYYAYRKRIPLYVPAELADTLWQHCLRAGMESPEERLTSLEDFFEVRPVEPRQAFAGPGGLELEMIRTRHIPGKASFSLYLDEDVFYSADMVFMREVLDEAFYERKVNWMLHECKLKPPGAVHTTLEELLTLPEEMQARIRLMHYDDEMSEYIGKTGSMRFLVQQELYEF